MTKYVLQIVVIIIVMCLTSWFEQNKVDCPICRSEIKNFFVMIL